MSSGARSGDGPSDRGPAGGADDAASRYHHGDLKRALLAAGLALLEQDGAAAVGLRAVARRVGVSPAAPYAHFKNKQALMSAIAAEGFERLGDDLSRLRQDGAAALSDFGLAYVTFAQRHPGLYRLMFERAGAVDPAYPPLKQASEALFALLTDIAAPRPPAPQQPARHPPEPTPAPIAAWSIAHGLSLLLIDERLQPHRQGQVKAILDLLETGITASARP